MVGIKGRSGRTPRKLGVRRSFNLSSEANAKLVRLSNKHRVSMSEIASQAILQKYRREEQEDEMKINSILSNANPYSLIINNENGEK